MTSLKAQDRRERNEALLNESQGSNQLLTNGEYRMNDD
jgi:hypothetical protein